MILYIDTSDFNNISFALIGKVTFQKSYQVDPHESHETMGFFQKFLKASKVNPKKITKIIVNKGPGSYTGVRIGVVMSQAFGFAWNVPVKALEKKKFDKALGHRQQA